MTVLRPYQQESIEALFAWWATEAGNTLIELPTGTGKSIVLSEISRRCLQWPDTKILVVTHVKELIEQNHKELMTLWPDAPAGINSAGVGRRDVDTAITFCSIQSVWKHAHKFGKTDIIIVDEAHLIPRDTSTMYRKFLDDVLVINPYAKVVGLTATPYRMDSGRLDEGDDRLFDGTCYQYGIGDAIQAGYLSPLTTKRTQIHLNTDGVKTRGGEFIAGDLERAVDTDENNMAAVSETIQWAITQKRKSWLFFCSGVKHAQHISDLVNANGFTCEVIHAQTSKSDRKRIIDDFKAGKITALASMNVLTTGFNAPAVDLIALLRPTKSAGLYVQMAGRGTRLSEGKTDCLVLDFANNIARFGPIDAINPQKPHKGEGGEAPIKTCPSCESVVHAATRECPDCGFVFPPPEVKVQKIASELPILMQQVKPMWVDVEGVSYGRHKKMGSPDSFVASYSVGLYEYREWICVEHVGYAGEKAKTWWSKRGGSSPTPKTTTEAIQRSGELIKPSEILIRPDGKYVSILSHRGMLSVSQGGEGVRLQSSSGSLHWS